MPAISDPGQDLVDICIASGVNVVSVPGPTAFATAVALSGLPSGRFTFEGFLSVNKQSRAEHLDSIKDEKRTMVFYEAPHKLLRTLKDLYACLGDRRTAIIKELTKIHENVERTTLKKACEKYESIPIKGEFVLVIEGAPQALRRFTRWSPPSRRQENSQMAECRKTRRQKTRQSSPESKRATYIKS